MGSEEVKQIRARLGLSQEALAHRLGVAFQTVSRWEREICKPSGLALEKLIKLRDKK